ncbi:aprataxin and PNK-like factor [Brachionichthys hirsutus]|uniref:aprataxin and PNK-like factor n=1 Tax=Brachionichthys hirsutus TaxID=412623 RepID=UPI0036049114
MSGFGLVHLDGGGPTRLPPGETVLGRGPLLGISDKRVSRHHGLLENLNGELRLKPTHINPCFVQSSLTDDPRPLQRGSWHPLRDGDLFSLLPGTLIYKVESVGGAHGPPRNSRMLEEEPPPASPRPDVSPVALIGQDGAQPPPQEEPPPEAPSHQEKQQQEEQEEQQEQRDVAPPEPRGRILPAWMMADLAPHSSSYSPSPKVPSGVKGRKGAAGKRAKLSSPEEEELSKEEGPKKRRRKMADEEDVALSSTVEFIDLEVPVERRLSGSTVEGGAEEGGATSEKAQREIERESVASDSGSAAPPTPGLRAPCPYGRDCYRKNPLHFQECSHPGDTDYEEEEEEADRPECPYGTDCYRKNLLHRKEYKHTKTPATRTRTAPRNNPAADEDEDDGFINDDSEDVADDSDYVPPDSDDDGEEEDIKRLQREAKAFLMKRR